MAKHRLFIGSLVAAVLLTCPRPSTAGIGELILEMSGPRMYGFLGECRFAIGGTLDSCKVAALKAGTANAGPFGSIPVWLTIGGGVYFSTEAKGFGWGEVWMFSFDPMIEIQSYKTKNNRISLYHGVMGLSYNFFVMNNDTVAVPNFTSAAMKLRPIGVGIHVGKKNKEIDIEYNLRLYPTAFTPEQFGKPPSATSIRGGEAVHGIGIGYRF